MRAFLTTLSVFLEDICEREKNGSWFLVHCDVLLNIGGGGASVGGFGSG